MKKRVTVCCGAEFVIGLPTGEDGNIIPYTCLKCRRQFLELDGKEVIFNNDRNSPEFGSIVEFRQNPLKDIEIQVVEVPAPVIEKLLRDISQCILNIETARIETIKDAVAKGSSFNVITSDLERHRQNLIRNKMTVVNDLTKAHELLSEALKGTPKI